MPTKIITKNGSGAPLASDLEQGELAVDLTNKRLYTEDAGGSVIEVGTSPSTIDINAGSIDGVTLGTNSAVTSAVITTADINGGTIDDTTIGGSTPAAGSFTTITGSGDMNIDSGTLFVDVSEDSVGIGTEDPVGRLSVATDQSAITTNAYFVNENRTDGVSQGIQQTFRLRGGALSTDRDAGYIRIGVDTANSGDYSGTSTRKSYMAFATAVGTTDEEAMRIDSSGNLDMTAGGGDIIMASGAGIDFSATADGTGASNVNELLDDYEAGTWTPTAVGNTSPGTTTYTDQHGTYTKIGNIVTVSFNIRYTALTGTGQLNLDGLPFIIRSNDSANVHIGSIMSDGLNWDVSTGSMVVMGTIGQTHMRIGFSQDNAALTLQTCVNETAEIWGSLTYRTD